MLHIRHIKVSDKGEIDDRRFITLEIEGLITERALNALNETVELHYRNGRTVINGDAAIPIASLIDVLERNNDYSEGRS